MVCFNAEVFWKRSVVRVGVMRDALCEHGSRSPMRTSASRNVREREHGGHASVVHARYVHPLQLRSCKYTYLVVCDVQLLDHLDGG